MKATIKNFLYKLGLSVNKIDHKQVDYKHSLSKIYLKYAEYSMIPKDLYIANLMLCNRFLNVDGDIVECGVWRGGMSAGIAEIAGKSKKFFLFDSFEGLPPAKEIDGKDAIHWQQAIDSENYYDNCAADINYADKAMNLAHVDFQLVKGWFNETLPKFDNLNPISILRLDGDWYESTLCCLKFLYPKVNKNGLIILDDYFAWDGCSRAVHDYLSSISSTSRIYTSKEGICYIIKNEAYGTA